MGDHTETLQLEYDPSQTTYEELLAIFWNGHQPTYRSSRQYMSAIFYHDEEQRQAAEKKTFYTAEDYHQKFDLRKFEDIAGVFTDEEIISSPVAAKLNSYLAGYGEISQLEKEIDGWNLPLAVVERVKQVVKRGDTSHFCGL